MVSTKKTFLTIFFSLLSMILLSCSSGPKPIEQTGEDVNPNVIMTEDGPVPVVVFDVEWGYSGFLAPQFWGTLSPEFQTCQFGTRQSPIDLVWQRPKQGGEILFEYQSAPVSLEDTGNGLTAHLQRAGKALLHGTPYELEKIQFHSMSEHTISGRKYPIEIQLVHKNHELGTVAIVSLLAVEGRHNPAFDMIWSNWPANEDSPTKLNEELNAVFLIPSILTHYHYEGSLTTPPCTEGVEWFVFNTPITLSPAQISKFRQKYPNNSRPIQPTNNREVINY